MTTEPTARKAAEKSQYTRWVMCERKKPYGNEKTARKRAKEFGMHYYMCPLCLQFHLTKTKQKAKV